MPWSRETQGGPDVSTAESSGPCSGGRQVPYSHLPQPLRAREHFDGMVAVVAGGTLSGVAAAQSSPGLCQSPCLVPHLRDLVPRVAVRWQPGDRPLQPRGTRVPEAAPLHFPGWQRHGLCPVSGRERLSRTKPLVTTIQTALNLALHGNRCPSSGYHTARTRVTCTHSNVRASRGQCAA